MASARNFVSISVISKGANAFSIVPVSCATSVGFSAS